MHEHGNGNTARTRNLKNVAKCSIIVTKIFQRMYNGGSIIDFSILDIFSIYIVKQKQTKNFAVFIKKSQNLFWPDRFSRSLLTF